MANDHGGHRTSSAYVVSTTEDFCKSPTAPVGYMISQVLESSDLVCLTVNGCGTPVLNFGSRVISVIGNEAGVGGGVVSVVNRGMCRPISNLADTVRAEGQCLVRHGTEMEMNCSSVNGPGNTRGVVMYSTAPGNTVPLPTLDESMWVNIDWTDLATIAAAVVLSPIAILLRPLAELFPETIAGFLESLPKTSAGTGKKSGPGGAVIGNNDGNGTPGIVGIAVSVAHKLSEILGGDGGAHFEKGQKQHDSKTGHGSTSNEFLSFAETIGQLLGIAIRELGDLIGLPLGDLFYQLVEVVFGKPDGYGFVGGVWKGTHQPGPVSF